MMTDKLEKVLAERSPFIQAAPDAASWYGVECGDGWCPLIREMCGEIAAAYEASGRLRAELGHIQTLCQKHYAQERDR